jgi:hypothetical protein
MALPAVGALSGDSFCFVSGGVLECVDPLTGQVRWRRRGMEANVTVFGDRDYVFVIPDGRTIASVLQVRDGQVLGERTVPQVMQQWVRRGRLVLAFEQKLSLFGARRLQLRLWDPWTEKSVWSKRFPDGTRGCLVGFDQLALIDPAGKLQILNLQDGSIYAETALSLSEPATGLEVIRSSERYLCFVFQNDPHFVKSLQPNGIRLQGPTRGTRQQHFTGKLLALDRATGQPLWPRPAEIQQYFLPSLQPSELPILPLYRAVQKQPVARTPRESDNRVKMQHELLCLDLRTGGVAAHRDPAPAMGQLLFVRGDPAHDTVDVLTDRRVAIRLALTEKPLTDSQPVVVPPLVLDQKP